MHCNFDILLRQQLCPLIEIKHQLEPIHCHQLQLPFKQIPTFPSSPFSPTFHTNPPDRHIAPHSTLTQTDPVLCHLLPRALIITHIVLIIPEPHALHKALPFVNPSVIRACVHTDALVEFVSLDTGGAGVFVDAGEARGDAGRAGEGEGAGVGGWGAD